MNPRHVFRRGNHLIARAARDAPDRPVQFICECTDASCLAPLLVTPEAFKDVSAAGARYIVLPGHEEHGVEEIVDEVGGYAVVDAWAALDARLRRIGAL